VLLLAAAAVLQAQTAANVLLVVNRRSAVSRQIGDYYRQKRGVPSANVCYLDTVTDETIEWKTYTDRIEAPVGECLKRAGLEEKVLYLVTTLGVPLRIDGVGGNFQVSEHSSVDSDLALLYAKRKGLIDFHRAGVANNPFFGKRDAPFSHPAFPIYLVTRLAGYDFNDVKGMIDRSLAARNRGKFVIDLSSGGTGEGNNWLRAAALLLPANRVILDETTTVLYDQQNVIGYASWGSNDGNRKRRLTGFQWLPGAIATEFVSTNARTMMRPPDAWSLTTYEDREHWFAGSPQSLSADYIHEGASGVSGNVFEPFLGGCVRPEYLLPAYAAGRNLAESYYLAMPFLSWQGVVLGDPLCTLKGPDGPAK
jgi:uncharacterized protein (TIGR03790 family)